MKKFIGSTGVSDGTQEQPSKLQAATSGNDKDVPLSSGNSPNHTCFRPKHLGGEGETLPTTNEAATAPVKLLLPHLQAMYDRTASINELGHYALGPLIGCGGMGLVFQGVDKRSGDAVALKLLAFQEDEDHTEQLKRFRREAKIVGSLSHESIVDIREFSSVDGIHFLVMDLFLGPRGVPLNLSDYAIMANPDDEPILAEREMRDIAISLLESIQYAHDWGVVHCDLKPANIILQYLSDADEGFWYGKLKLTDFGLARIVGEDLVMHSVTQSLNMRMDGSAELPADAGALIGTFDYMSPEQRRGETATFRSDVFTIGLMIFRLLTGKRELGLRGRPSRYRPDINPDWDTVIMTAMREDPMDRYQSAVEMMEQIRAITV